MHRLVKSVTVTIGGDSTPRWYCAKCAHFKSDAEPAFGTVCGQELKEFSYDLFRAYWKEERGEDITDEGIDNLPGQWVEYIDDVHNVYTTKTCDSREFCFEKRKGVKVDEYDSEYLNMWEQLSAKSPQGWSRMLGEN